MFFFSSKNSCLLSISLMEGNDKRGSMIDEYDFIGVMQEEENQ